MERGEREREREGGRNTHRVREMAIGRENSRDREKKMYSGYVREGEREKSDIIDDRYE